MSVFFGMVSVFCITWVSKFFVTQSHFVTGSKGFGSVVKQDAMERTLRRRGCGTD